MSVLFAVKSCIKDQQAGFHQAIRDTWGKHIQPPNELKFFTGGVSQCDIYDSIYGDEVLLPVKDGYQDLPFKVRMIMNFFLATKHDFVFLCDTDTFVIPSQLLGTNYEESDLTGIFIKGLKPGQKFIAIHGSLRGRENYVPPSGGFGYFLSRKAAQIVANTVPNPNVTEDDIYVGEALGPYFESGELKGNQPADYHNYAFHFLKAKTLQYAPLWMHRMYKLHNEEK